MHVRRTVRSRTFKNIMLLTWIIILIAGILYAVYSGMHIRTYIDNGNKLAHGTTPYSQPGKGNLSILVLGDSLAYGVGASKPEMSFAGRLGARYPNASVRNKAKIGENIDGLASSMGQLIDHHYNLIFIIVGGNDVSHYGVNIEHSKQSLANVYQTAAKNSDQTFTYTSVDFQDVTAIPTFLKSFYSHRSLILRERSQSLAAQYKNVTYVDTFDVDAKLYKSLQATDGLHLNDRGIQMLISATFGDEKSS